MMMMMMMVPSIPNDTQSLLCCTLAFTAENRALFRFTMIPPGLYNPLPCYKGIARSPFFVDMGLRAYFLCIWVCWCGGEKEFGSRFFFLQRRVMWIACA
jgi:hypothetical protein